MRVLLNKTFLSYQLHVRNILVLIILVQGQNTHIRQETLMQFLGRNVRQGSFAKLLNAWLTLFNPIRTLSNDICFLPNSVYRPIVCTLLDK